MRIRGWCSGAFVPICQLMTHEPNNAGTEELRFSRGSESWLVGAFLVFFSVAVASAMPAIAAAARTAAADAARGVSNEQLKLRVVVRAEVRGIRMVLPPSSDSAAALPATASLQTIPIVRPAVTLRGLGALFRERGFNARAPPLPIA